MIKVLYTINGLRVNGMSSVIMQYISGLDKNVYSFSVFTDEIDPFYLPLLEENKVHVFQSHMRRTNQLVYYRELRQIMNEGRFDILHAHGNSATIAVELVAAKRCGIPMRIAHSHNTTCDHKMIDKLLRPVFYTSYTHGIGCGIEAGKWLFGKRPHIVIKNGVDLERYRFDAETRNRIRRELDLDGKTVLGHIGRFTDQKNHIFLLNVFKQYIKSDPDSVLLLVGNGPLEEKMKNEAFHLGIKENVIFYGTTPNPEFMYSAMDYYVFPSKYEGLPLTLVEAQANGLPCLISDKISSEVMKTDLVHSLPIDSADKWAAKIPRCFPRTADISETAIRSLENSGFGLNGVLESINELYMQVAEQR